MKAFRILGIGLIFGGVSLVLSASFQSFGEGTYSLIITMCRKVVITLPLIFIFKNTFGISIVWWAVSMAEIITMVVSIFLFSKVKRKNNIL